MADLPLTINDGLRDIAPDLIWPSMLWTIGGESLIRRFVELQKDLSARIGEPYKGDNAPDLDGRLTSIESWTKEQIEEHGPYLKTEISSRGLIPDELLASLRLFPGVPGAWLLVEPWAEREIDEEANAHALILLASAIGEWARGGHLEALTEFLMIVWDGPLRKKLTFGLELIEHLIDYPSNVTKRDRADSAVCSAFKALQAARAIQDPRVNDAPHDWAKRFWNQNWQMSACIPEYGLPSQGSPIELAPQREPEPTPSNAGGYDPTTPFTKAAALEARRFTDAYFSAGKRDLYGNAAADEVVSGLIMRAAKATWSFVKSPHQWSEPFAASTMRLLAETEILLAWFRAHPEDIIKYQDYGRGRDKLTWLHTEDIIDSFGDDLPEELAPVAEHIEQRKRTSEPFDVTIVSVDSYFNGKSLRIMADQVGLAELYRTIYQPSSGVLHGEWGPIERNDLTRCVNPLHRFHLMPSMRSPWTENEILAKAALNQLGKLVSDAIKVVAPDTDVDRTELKR